MTTAETGAGASPLRGIAHGLHHTLARHVDQRPAGRVPGPVGIGNAVPGHAGAQSLAGVLALCRTLQRGAAVSRDAAAPPLDHRGWLAVHQARNGRWAAEVVDNVLHQLMLGQPSDWRKYRLA